MMKNEKIVLNVHAIAKYSLYCKYRSFKIFFENICRSFDMKNL